MNSSLFFIGVIALMVVIFQLVWRRVRGPQLIVRGLLRHYHGFAKAGLSEPECLYRVLSKRSGWKKLPGEFLAEIVARLGSKEDVFRFVSLAEGYRFDRQQLPVIAANRNPDAAIRYVVLWLVDFGKRLHSENQLKQAEFVQKLALRFEPDRVFTLLPLATTYRKMARHEEAAALFEAGLSRLESCAAGDLDLVEAGASREDLRARCREARASCLQVGADRWSAAD